MPASRVEDWHSGERWLSCVVSVLPTAAALSALRNRATNQGQILEEQVLDEDEESDTPDLEPDLGRLSADANDPNIDPLSALIEQAKQVLLSAGPQIRCRLLSFFVRCWIQS